MKNISITKALLIFSKLAFAILVYTLRQSIFYYIGLFKSLSFSLLTPLINLLTNYFKILINQSLGPLTLQRCTWIWKTPEVAPKGYFHGYNKTDHSLKHLIITT